MQELEAARMVALVALLGAIAVVDVKKRIVPNGAVAAIVAVHGLSVFAGSRGIAAAACTIASCALAGMAALGMGLLLCAIVKRVTGNEGMGGGDVKLLGALAFALGLRSTLTALFVASAAAALVSLARKRSRSETFPFCPYLGLGCVVALSMG